MACCEGVFVNLAEVAMAAAITASIAGISYVALSPTVVEHTAQATADKATCRAVDEAIVGYLAANDTPPTTITQLGSYVTGDITAYRIVRGVAAGPGCTQP
jgi:hypothetical protein